MRVLALIALAVPAVLAAQERRDDFSEPRNATVDAGGARSVRIEAAAGLLRVTGVAGLDEVRVRGTARATRRAWLDDIELEARREGGVVVVKVEIPELRDMRSYSRDGDDYRLLDLVVEVPAGMDADITDGSGELAVRGLGDVRLTDGSGEIDVARVGSLELTDGSGGIVVVGVRGDVTLTDGSGEVEVRDVGGDMTVTDGSGTLVLEEVEGTVRVRLDASGNIQVSRVGGDFIVERDGSGTIEHRAVRGRVTLPADPRRRRADRDDDDRDDDDERDEARERASDARERARAERERARERARRERDPR